MCEWYRMCASEVRRVTLSGELRVPRTCRDYVIVNTTRQAASTTLHTGHRRECDVCESAGRPRATAARPRPRPDVARRRAFVLLLAAHGTSRPVSQVYCAPLLLQF